MTTHLIRLRSRAGAARGSTAAPHPLTLRQGAEQVAAALGSPVQARLTLGAPDDAQERDADAVADRVMRMPDGAAGVPAGSGVVQRKCAQCEEEEALQRRTAQEETEEEEVQAKAAPGGAGGAGVAADTAARIRSRRGAGEPLPAAERAFFEPRLGHDLSGVRIHADAAAAEMNRGLHARAFTVGSDVFFGPGEFRPGTPSGRHLMAHELTHVLQQAGAGEATLRRLAISRHSFSQGDCGQRRVEWVFSLSQAAATDGYIVQKVVPAEVTMGCGLFGGLSMDSQTYWEAWKIKKGDKVDWTTTRDSWTDASSYGAHSGVSGIQVTPGEVKYFPVATTGDLGDFGVAPATSNGWGPGKVARAGDLPSTPNEPSWWGNTPTEGPVTREARSEWNCCDADKKKQSSKSSAKP
jgi:hypothetical protein